MFKSVSALAAIFLIANTASASTKCIENPGACTWSCNGAKYKPSKSVVWSETYFVPRDSQKVNINSNLINQKREFKSSGLRIYDCIISDKKDFYKCNAKRDYLESFYLPTNANDATSTTPIPDRLLLKNKDSTATLKNLLTRRVRQELAINCYENKETNPIFINANLHRVRDNNGNKATWVEIRFIDAIKK